MFSTKITIIYFSYGSPLCKLWQKDDLDLREAVNLAGTTVSAIQKLRDNITKEFQKLFKEAEVRITHWKIEVSRINIDYYINKIKKKKTFQPPPPPHTPYKIPENVTAPKVSGRESPSPTARLHNIEIIALLSFYHFAILQV